MVNNANGCGGSYVGVDIIIDRVVKYWYAVQGASSSDAWPKLINVLAIVEFNLLLAYYLALFA
jgi:hypothetical protein